MTDATERLDLVYQIIDMDTELDKDPLYKEYEDLYAKSMIRNKVIAGIKDKGLLGDVGEDEINMITQNLFLISKIESEGVELTPEHILEHKDSVMNHVKCIMELTLRDEEYELTQKLKEFVDLLKKL